MSFHINVKEIVLLGNKYKEFINYDIAILSLFFYKLLSDLYLLFDDIYR